MLRVKKKVLTQNVVYVDLWVCAIQRSVVLQWRENRSPRKHEAHLLCAYFDSRIMRPSTHSWKWRTYATVSIKICSTWIPIVREYPQGISVWYQQALFVTNPVPAGMVITHDAIIKHEANLVINESERLQRKHACRATCYIWKIYKKAKKYHLLFGWIRVKHVLRNEPVAWLMPDSKRSWQT